jgi:hypothetical protein
MSPRLVAVVAALALPTGARAHEAALSRYTYWEHVRPIFEKHCASCHREGGVGPMSLLEYQSAVPWSNAIQLQVLSRTMPPFLPEDESGPFRGARGLSAEELDVLIDWTVGATPEGEPGDAPSAPAPQPAPEVLLEAVSDVVLDSDEHDETECVSFPPLSSAGVLSAMTVRSQSRSVLRRATLYAGGACVEGSPVLTWLPDQDRASFPKGVGWELSAGTALALELRYAKGWNEEGARITDRPALGLWFSPSGVAVRTRRVEASEALASGAVEIVALYPDAAAGPDSEPVRVEAVAPDGSVKPLLVMGAFDRAWREKYCFDAPVRLPAGSRVRVSRPVVWVDFLSE